MIIDQGGETVVCYQMKSYPFKIKFNLLLVDSKMVRLTTHGFPLLFPNNNILISKNLFLLKHDGFFRPMRD